jgi:hypothetical protein
VKPGLNGRVSLFVVACFQAVRSVRCSARVKCDAQRTL